MHAGEMILSVVEIIRTYTEIEVNNADGVDFLYLLITFTQRDMLGDGFGHAVEDTFEIMYFAGVLDFDDDDLAFAVQCFDVYTVELVAGTFLVAFAFEDFKDTNLFPKHDCQETVKHIEVGLLAQQTVE